MAKAKPYSVAGANQLAVRNSTLPFTAVRMSISSLPRKATSFGASPCFFKMKAMAAAFGFCGQSPRLETYQGKFPQYGLKCSSASAFFPVSLSVTDQFLLARTIGRMPFVWMKRMSLSTST